MQSAKNLKEAGKGFSLQAPAQFTHAITMRSNENLTQTSIKIFTLVLYEVVIEISTALHSVCICICK